MIREAEIGVLHSDVEGPEGKGFRGPLEAKKGETKQDSPIHPHPELSKRTSPADTLTLCHFML